MTSVISTASTSVSAATSITVPLGSTPAIGNLVLVFLATSNQIVVHPPGWNVSGPGVLTNQQAWVKAQGLQSSVDASKLEVFYRTWNAADSGSSATFAFSPAPSLGVGDKDLSTANAQAISLVLSACAVQEFSQQSSLDFSVKSLLMPPVKQQNSGGFIITAAAMNAASSIFSISDGLAALRNSVNTPAGSLAVWTSTGSPGYGPVLSSSASGELLGAFLTVHDGTPNIYNPPVIYEAPVADNALFYRYSHQRQYTVLNNGGTFSVRRYIDTDTFNAATQVFRGNAPILPADYTNLLNAGVGGDFRFSLTGS